MAVEEEVEEMGAEPRSVHREALDRPESLLADRAWSLCSGLLVADTGPPPPPPALLSVEPSLGLLVATAAGLSREEPWHWD